MQSLPSKIGILLDHLINKYFSNNSSILQFTLTKYPQLAKSSFVQTSHKLNDCYEGVFDNVCESD